jgi:hypothetical protein
MSALPARSALAAAGLVDQPLEVLRHRDSREPGELGDTPHGLTLLRVGSTDVHGLDRHRGQKDQAVRCGSSLHALVVRQYAGQRIAE